MRRYYHDSAPNLNSLNSNSLHDEKKGLEKFNYRVGVSALGTAQVLHEKKGVILFVPTHPRLVYTRVNEHAAPSST